MIQVCKSISLSLLPKIAPSICFKLKRLGDYEWICAVRFKSGFQNHQPYPDEYEYNIADQYRLLKHFPISQLSLLYLLYNPIWVK